MVIKLAMLCKFEMWSNCNSPILVRFILIIFIVCLIVLVCEYSSLGEFSWVFVLEG